MLPQHYVSHSGSPARITRTTVRCQALAMRALLLLPLLTVGMLSTMQPRALAATAAAAVSDATAVGDRTATEVRPEARAIDAFSWKATRRGGRAILISRSRASGTTGTTSTSISSSNNNERSPVYNKRRDGGDSNDSSSHSWTILERPKAPLDESAIERALSRLKQQLSQPESSREDSNTAFDGEDDEAHSPLDQRHPQGDPIGTTATAPKAHELRDENKPVGSSSLFEATPQRSNDRLTHSFIKEKDASSQGVEKTSGLVNKTPENEKGEGSTAHTQLTTAKAAPTRSAATAAATATTASPLPSHVYDVKLADSRSGGLPISYLKESVGDEDHEFFVDDAHRDHGLVEPSFRDMLADEDEDDPFVSDLEDHFSPNDDPIFRSSNEFYKPKKASRLENGAAEEIGFLVAPESVVAEFNEHSASDKSTDSKHEKLVTEKEVIQHLVDEDFLRPKEVHKYTSGPAFALYTPELLADAGDLEPAEISVDELPLSDADAKIVENAVSAIAATSSGSAGVAPLSRRPTPSAPPALRPQPLPTEKASSSSSWTVPPGAPNSTQSTTASWSRQELTTTNLSTTAPSTVQKIPQFIKQIYEAAANRLPSFMYVGSALQDSSTSPTATMTAAVTESSLALSTATTVSSTLQPNESLASLITVATDIGNETSSQPVVNHFEAPGSQPSTTGRVPFSPVAASASPPKSTAAGNHMPSNTSRPVSSSAVTPADDSSIVAVSSAAQASKETPSFPATSVAAAASTGAAAGAAAPAPAPPRYHHRPEHTNNKTWSLLQPTSSSPTELAQTTTLPAVQTAFPTFSPSPAARPVQTTLATPTRPSADHSDSTSTSTGSSVAYGSDNAADNGDDDDDDRGAPMSVQTTTSSPQDTPLGVLVRGRACDQRAADEFDAAMQLFPARLPELVEFKRRRFLRGAVVGGLHTLRATQRNVTCNLTAGTTYWGFRFRGQTDGILNLGITGLPRIFLRYTGPLTVKVTMHALKDEDKPHLDDVTVEDSRVDEIHYQSVLGFEQPFVERATRYLLNRAMKEELVTPLTDAIYEELMRPKADKSRLLVLEDYLQTRR